MEYITMNELLESIKLLCKEYGDFEVLAISPMHDFAHSIHIRIDGLDKWVYVPAFKRQERSKHNEK